VFVEDTSPNLQPAHALGMRTVLLGPPAGRASQDNHGVDFHIGHILELEGVLAGLTDGGK
jgi:FMN phosphatase YigB (HAD superfamily)